MIRCKMKRYRLIVLFSILFTVFLSSCNIFVTENELMAIVESEICEVPCWQGITPGLTTKDDLKIQVMGLLSRENKTSTITPTYIGEKERNDGLWITLTYKELGIEVSVYGRQNIVEKIEFFFVNQKPRLKSVLNIVGTPEIVGVCHEIFEIRRELVYFENPISRFLYTKQLQINGTSFTVEYFPGTRVEWIEFLENPKYPGYDFVYPWTDFGQSSFNPENDDPDRPCPDYGK